MYVETDQSHDLNGFTRDKAFLQYELKIKSSAHLELKLDTLEFDNDLNCMFNEFQNFFLEVLTKYALLIPLKTGENKSKKPPWLSN